MKKTAASSGWMELLDKEKEWTWGHANPGFDSNVAQYQCAVEELGRPLDVRDKTGKWKTVYQFWTTIRSPSRFRRLLPAQKAIIQNLPYFSHSPIEETARKSLAELVEFKARFDRLPHAKAPEERSLYSKHLYLRSPRLHKHLPKPLLDEIAGHGLLNTHRSITALAQLGAIKAFVKQHKRWPSRSGHLTGERKLHYCIKGILKRHRSGRPTTLPVKDILSVPCCPYTVTPRVYKKGHPS